MALTDFRDTHSWQQAIGLGPHLVRLAEELPAAEATGLAMQLRQAMTDLPTNIALDMLEGGSYSRRLAAVRILAILDLIDKIYPALDTATVRTKLEQLIDRIAGDGFKDRLSTNQPAHPETDLPVHTEADPSTPDPADQTESAPAPAPLPEPAENPIAADTQEPHVQPDSLQ